jgi:hypothetical protein
MALSMDGLASGLQTGFSLGSSFFNDIENKKLRAQQLERQSVLDARADEQWEVQKQMQEIQLGQLQKQQKQKALFQEVQPLISQYEQGMLPPEKKLEMFRKLGIDPSALVDQNNTIYKGAKKARDAFGGGQVDFNDTDVQNYLDYRFGQRLTERSDGVSRNGQPITNLRIVGLEPAPNNPEALVPILEVTDVTGETYTAPMTQGGSAGANDEITQIPLDMLIPKVMSDETIMRSALSDDQVMSLVKGRLDAQLGDFREFKDGYFVNTLTGTANKVIPDEPKSKGEFARIIADPASSPTDKQMAQQALKLMAEADADAYLTKTQSAIPAQMELAQAEQDIKDLADLRAKLGEEIDTNNQNVKDLQALVVQMDNLDPNDTNALAEFTLAIDKLFVATGLSSNPEVMDRISRLDAFNAAATKVGLMGLAYFKGAISEKELATAMKLAPSITNTQQANEQIVAAQLSSSQFLDVQNGFLNFAYANRALTAGQRIEAGANIRMLLTDVPLLAEVATSDGGTQPMYYSQYRQNMLTAIARGQASVPEGSNVDLMIMQAWARDTGDNNLAAKLSAENLRTMGVIR